MDPPAAPAASAASFVVSPAALDLHRSLARDCNMLADLSNRLGRKAAARKIADALAPAIARTKPKVATSATTKPKLIFSAKAMAAADAAPTPEPVVATPATSTVPAPLTAEQQEAIALLDSLLHLPCASGSQTLLSLLVARISDEMENVRATVLQLALDIVDAIGRTTSQSLLPEFLPVIYARLNPSAASISAAASFAASSMPSSSSLAPAPLSAVSMHGGIAIPSSTGLTIGVGGSGLSSGGAGTGVHLEPSEELRLKLLQLLLKLVECEKAKYFARIAAASASTSSSSSDPASSSPPLQLVYGSLDKLVAIVLKTMTDPFPDLKKSSCELVSLLADLLALNPQGITNQARMDAANALQKALLPNLKHQHSQVRLQSLTAFGSVVRQMGGEALSSATIDALPVLSSLLGDRTPKVREVFIAELSGWLISLPRLLPSAQTKFLGLLLNLTADEVPEIARAAVSAINTAATKLEEWRAKEEAMGDDPSAAAAASDSTFLTSVKESPSNPAVAMSVDSAASGDADWLPASLAAPFLSRPPAAARAFVRSHSQDLLPPILQELSDWTLARRVVAAGSLRALLVYLEDGVIPSLVPLLQALLKSIRDESSAVHGALSACAELLGFFLRDPTVYLEWMLPELERNAESTYRNSLLMVLLNLIKGMPILIQAGSPSASAANAAAGAAPSHVSKEALAANEAKIARIFPLLLNTLSSPDLCCSDDAPLRLQLHRILVCVLSRIPRQCGSRLFADKIFHMIVQLDTKSVPAVGSAAASAGAASASEEEKQVMAALELLARCELQTGELQLPASSTPPSSAQLLRAVYCAHFPRELALLLGPDVVASPSTAADSLPASWGQGASKDAAVNFVALTFFQLLDRAAGISTMGVAAALAPAASSSASSSSSAAAAGSAPSSSSPVSLLLESSLPTLLPVLIHSARPSNDHAIRSLVLNFIYKLALLHGGGILRAADPSVLSALITEVLVPQTVWKSGKVAAALRFHALTVLHALFSQGLVTPPIVMQTAGKLLPVLHANLDDDEAKMRMLVLLLLQSMLLLVPAGSIRVGDDSLTELHRDLLKRLDDSHDDIRLEVVATFTLLFHRVFPPASEYDKTQSYYRYILQTFYIHLDDSNPRIIDACFQFLKGSMEYDRKVFVEETEKAKKKQTTGQYCEQLMAWARQNQ